MDEEVDEEVDPFVELGLSQSDPDSSHTALCHDDWVKKDAVWVGILQKWMHPVVCARCGYLTAVDADPPASLDDVSQAEFTRAERLQPYSEEKLMEGGSLGDLVTRSLNRVTPRYVDTLLRGPVDPFAGFDPDHNKVALWSTWECRSHPDFLTHEEVEWHNHLKDYHPRQWAQRQIDLSDVRCPGCDTDPVGYAPHNGEGDCPPKA